MGRLGIFIDGGYIDKLAAEDFNLWVDYEKFVKEISRVIRDETEGPVDLLRTYYYNCLPYQSEPPTSSEQRQFAAKRKFFQALTRLSRFSVRQGRLAFRGNDSQGKPIFQQKRVDLMLGLDFALLSGKSQITHAALVAGDSDFIPVVEFAKQEGIVVWLFHGPIKNKRGASTFARELWDVADERFELTQTFMDMLEK